MEARLRMAVTISEEQFGFMPGRSTTCAIFALRMLAEKHREGQKELHCVLVDLEKAYDQAPRWGAVALYARGTHTRSTCEGSTGHVQQMYHYDEMFLWDDRRICHGSWATPRICT